MVIIVRSLQLFLNVRFATNVVVQLRIVTNRNEQPPVIHGTISECQIGGKRGHTALTCFHRSNYAYQGINPPSTLTAMTTQSYSNFNPNQAWDIGANHHMTGDLNDLDMIAPFEGDQNITVGNGECLLVKNTGSHSLHT